MAVARAADRVRPRPGGNHARTVRSFIGWIPHTYEVVSASWKLSAEADLPRTIPNWAQTLHDRLVVTARSRRPRSPLRPVTSGPFAPNGIATCARPPHVHAIDRIPARPWGNRGP